MRYARRIASIFFAIMLLFGAMMTSVSAQSRTVVIRRPVIVRSYNPFWGWVTIRIGMIPIIGSSARDTMTKNRSAILKRSFVRTEKNITLTAI